MWLHCSPDNLKINPNLGNLPKMSSALRTSMSYRNGRELHHVTVWQVISDSIIMAILIAIVVYLENFAQPFIGGYSWVLFENLHKFAWIVQMRRHDVDSNNPSINSINRIIVHWRCSNRLRDCNSCWNSSSMEGETLCELLIDRLIDSLITDKSIQPANIPNVRISIMAYTSSDCTILLVIWHVGVWGA